MSLYSSLFASLVLLGMYGRAAIVCGEPFKQNLANFLIEDFIVPLTN